jgi:2-C-methyl-D-erythritol 4-phosphate cytidylyltransferase / 2-C-methyl-D-erythritol 2,4-cyclodiphosphate synthase
MNCWAIIVAGGSGQRFGTETPKQYLPLLERPLLWWTLDVFDRSPDITGIVLVVGAEHRNLAEEMLRQHPLTHEPMICNGGKERADSVMAGLGALPEGVKLVAVHDGARPLLTQALLNRVVREGAQYDAAIAALPAHDTIKTGRSIIERTVDRTTVWLAQTPQVFSTRLLRDAYQSWNDAGCPPVTDDAEVVERMGREVRLVTGERHNIKITVAEDIRLAEALLHETQGSPMDQKIALPRTGFGFDVHALVQGRKLILGGVTIEHPVGLDGHSDADVLCHAIADALLGAAALGDIGVHFPPTDAQFKDADSIELLRQVGGLVHEAGFRLGNIDTVIACQSPKLSPHLAEMTENIATALSTAPSNISLKATTTERLGYVGREEGIAAYSTVLLAPR